jgi:acyl-CoA hydrolase
MKTVASSETTYTELMIPSFSNFGGKVHGGILLSIMDKVAYVCASKHSESYVVTVAVEGVEFVSPVEVGELITVKASVNYVGKTTMIVGMRLESFNTRTSESRYTNSCYFTMAAKNDDGSLKEVPGLIISNKQELVRFCEGRMIREMSLKKRTALKSDLDGISAEQMSDLCKNENCKINYTL